MKRLLKIELKKVLKYKVFWILISLYIIGLVSAILGMQGFIDEIAENASKRSKIPLPTDSVFNFPNIWHNITYISSGRYFIKVVLGVIIIILATNEFNYKTIRQSIINGLSKADIIWGKVYLIIVLSVISTLVLFFLGLFLGIRNTEQIEIGLVFEKAEFLLAYFVELTSFLLFTFFIAFLVKRSGLAIGILFFYTLAEHIISYRYSEIFDNYLPLQAMNHIIQIPHSKLMALFNLYDSQQNIANADVLICVGYSVFFVAVTYFVLRRRDV